MSDADRVGLAYKQESSYGVFPTGNPTLRNVLFTSESLVHNKNLVRSNEIRTDRQRDAAIRTSVNASGAINFELWPTAFEDFLKASIQSDADWSAKALVAGANATIAAVAASGGSFTSSTVGLFDSLSVGDWVDITGFATAANNGFFKVTAVVSSPASISVSTIGTSTIVDESAGEFVTVVKCSKIAQGTTMPSFAFEKHFSDLTNVYHRFLGMALSSLSLSANVDQIITGSMDFIGAEMTVASATGGDGTNDPAVLAAYTGEPDPFTAAADKMGVILGAFADSTVMRALGFGITIANNVRNKLRIGKLAPFEQGAGMIDITGTARLYFVDNTVMNTFINDSEFNAALVVTQDDITTGQSTTYVIDLPRVKFSSAPVIVGGSNQDVIADVSWTAIRDVTEGNTITIQRAGPHVT